MILWVGRLLCHLYKSLPAIDALSSISSALNSPCDFLCKPCFQPWRKIAVKHQASSIQKRLTTYDERLFAGAFPGPSGAGRESSTSKRNSLNCVASPRALTSATPLRTSRLPSYTNVCLSCRIELLRAAMRCPTFRHLPASSSRVFHE